MLTTTELPQLLRGCIRWSDGAASVDNEALLVVADWCEENGLTEEATVIRAPFKFKGGLAAVGQWYVRITSRSEALAVRHEMPKNATSSKEYERQTKQYESFAGFDNETRYQPTPDEFASTSLRRIRDLARWDLICHMLGWPPLRLVGEG